MEFIENTGAVLEESSVDAATVTNNEPTIEDFAEAITGTDVDFLETPAAAMATRANEIHQGVVTSISVETAKTGTRSFLINLQSKDTGAAFRYNIYPPADFFNPEFWENGNFALDKLSKESPGLNDKGRPKQSPYQRFGATITSKDAKTLPNGSLVGFADVQLLRQIAKNEGRVGGGHAAPTSGDDYGAILNALCSGINVVFTLVTEKSAEYGDRQKVGKIHPATVLMAANFDKQFPVLYVDQKTGDTKGFLRAWAQ